MTNFSNKLDSVLQEYLDNPGVHTSIRISCDLAERKRVLAESALPKSGIYWWAPGPDDGQWQIVSFWHEFYGDDIVHYHFWDKFIVNYLVSTLNLPRTAVSKLKGLYRSLPRGRVIKKNNGEYNLHHGNDIPSGYSVNQVFDEFSLPNNTPVVVSPHEIMDTDDYNALCAVVGDLGLRM